MPVRPGGSRRSPSIWPVRRTTVIPQRGCELCARSRASCMATFPFECVHQKKKGIVVVSLWFLILLFIQFIRLQLFQQKRKNDKADPASIPSVLPHCRILAQRTHAYPTAHDPTCKGICAQSARRIIRTCHGTTKPHNVRPAVTTETI